MTESFTIGEPLIRLAVFIGVLSVVAASEAFFPRRKRSFPRSLRWTNNLGIAALDALFVRLVLPAAAVSAALFAEERGWGVLNVVDIPQAAAIALSVLLLDLAIYVQHVVFHAVPVLWRVHRMHHADLDFDVTTGIRFHPIEMLLSAAIKMVIVVALGAPAAGVLVFEVVLNASSLFNHANLRLPGAVDRVLRWVIVTPDMHRVHHSIARAETDSNFGFNLPWWDRLFGTYQAQPAAGHEAMTIGIEQFRDARELWLDRMLVQPFRGDSGRPAGLGGEADGKPLTAQASVDRSGT